MQQESDKNWYAIRTRNVLRAEELLSEERVEVFLPAETLRSASGATRRRAIIPHVLFIKTSERHALQLEAEGKHDPAAPLQFWIYRYPQSTVIQPITEQQVNLLRLLTADDATRCRIYRKSDFVEGQRVRVSAGPFAGYSGSVQRVRKNRHVVVRIEGICMILLPFIHPDLLEPI